MNQTILFWIISENWHRSDQHIPHKFSSSDFHKWLHSPDINLLMWGMVEIYLLLCSNTFYLIFLGYRFSLITNTLYTHTLIKPKGILKKCSRTLITICIVIGMTAILHTARERIITNTSYWTISTMTPVTSAHEWHKVSTTNLVQCLLQLPPTFTRIDFVHQANSLRYVCRHSL